ncbi:hypothetical protein [Streptomyces sp. NPDC051684]|uniref:hypothetical protein n=1 Tax=Streptomyces sp. NPDC051684 TaxID=3365670 RepID=UPI0037AE4F2F
MTTQTTSAPPDLANQPEPRVLADQRQALAALDRIIELHPQLPAAHITFSVVYRGLVTVQAQEWHHLEMWRVALNVHPTSIELGVCEPRRQHLEFEAAVDGARVQVYVLGDERPAPASAAVTA